MECNGVVIGDRNRLSFCAFSIVFSLFMFEKGLLCSFLMFTKCACANSLRCSEKAYHMEDTMTIFSNIWLPQDRYRSIVYFTLQWTILSTIKFIHADYMTLSTKTVNSCV